MSSSKWSRAYEERSSHSYSCGWIDSWASETERKSDAIMSLKNYIFASINTKSNSSNQLPFEDIPLPHSRNRTMTSNLTPVPELPPNNNAATLPKPQNWLKKAWSFVSVEPVMICWILPSCFLYIAIENLALEKVSLICLYIYKLCIILFRILMLSVMPSELWISGCCVR